MFLEVLVSNIQPMVQKDYQYTKSYEELLKDAKYVVISKKRQKDAGYVVSSGKRHIRASNKFKLRSKALHNASLMTEFIDVDRQSEGL